MFRGWQSTCSRHQAGGPIHQFHFAVAPALDWSGFGHRCRFVFWHLPDRAPFTGKLRLPCPWPVVGHVFSGFEFLGILLITAVPFGIYDLVEAILGAMAACIIDRNFKKAAGFALAGAALTFFGFMHGERIGLGQTPVVAVSYLLVSGLLFSCARVVVVVKPATALTESPPGHVPSFAE